jgi:radical SAM superfamily enzyme YgiQ (UPF0313 family)
VTIERITLVRCDPRSSNVYAAFAHPGLALPLLATVLGRAGYEVRVYVEAIEPPPWDELLRSDLVGITVNSACFQESYALADRLRAAGARCRVVFGGPHVTFLPEQALAHGDFVVRGEGERAILELVKALERGGDGELARVAGLSWRGADGVMQHNPAAPLAQDIELVPDQSLVVGFRRYLRTWWQRLFPTGVLVSTSRGCPHRCTFCSIPQTAGSTVRFRSLDAVMADIRQQISLSGRRYVYFADDNFTADLRRTKALLRRMLAEPLEIRFSAQIRPDAARDPELLDLLQRAGCYLVFVGFESINDATLAAYRKGIASRAVLEHSVREFRRRRILVHGMFVVGSEEDGPGTALRTAQWAAAQRLDSIQILPLYPLPGTQVLGELEQAGRVYKAWDPVREEAYIPYGAGNLVLTEPRHMPADGLQEELLRAHRRFYSRAEIARAALELPRRGLHPLVFRLLGRRLVRQAEPEIREHVAWLRGREPYRQRARARPDDGAFQSA